MSSSLLTYLRPEVAELKKRLDEFVENECIPAEEEYEAHVRKFKSVKDRFSLKAIPTCMNRLKERAKALGLWNLFIPPHLIDKVPDPALRPSLPLSYREYGMFCEVLGKCPHIAPEACNTSAPDTGNMEVLLEFGTSHQKKHYLLPLLRGEIRSAFLMTEPQVASSDPTNLETKLVKRQASNGTVEYLLIGRKWWSTGAMDPRCRFALVVARMENSNSNKHGVHTIVLVPMPQTGVVLERALTLFGYDDAPSGHAEVSLQSVCLTKANLIAGEGSGFRVSQARLGP